MNGYFEHMGTLGKIELSSFKMLIKGLNVDFDQEINFELKEWENILRLFSTGASDYPLKFLIGKFGHSN
jgi:hypothetical protein